MGFTKKVFCGAVLGTAVALVACSTAWAQATPMKIDPKPSADAVRAQIVFTDKSEDDGSATACFVDVPNFIHVPKQGKNKVRFVLINLCNGVNIDDVEIGRFDAAQAASYELCAGVTTTGQPFTQAKGNGKPGKVHQTRRGIAITFDVGANTGCWKYNLTITERGKPPYTIDPVIRIDR